MPLMRFSLYAARPLIPYTKDFMMKYASLALLLSLTLAGGSAHAQILNGSAGLTGSASTTGNDTSVSTDVSADVDASTSDSDAVDETGNDASVSGQVGSSVGLFNFVRSDMGDDSTNYAVTEADSVRTSASLESYAAATVRSDERLKSLEMTENGMEMVYRKAAKFLWIFPASLTARVTVDQQGDVEVRYPWYAFLMSTDESKAALEAEIRDEVNAIDDSIEAAGDAEVTVTASSGIQADPMIRRWARIIEAAYIAVSGDARVGANVQASS